MWNFKSTFMIALLCCTVSQNLAKPVDDDDDVPTTCDEDMIDLAHRFLEYYKQAYYLTEMPTSEEPMKAYVDVLKDFRKYYQYLVDNCPESNHTYYGEYLARHAEMEECVESFLTDEDEKALKCMLLKDQSNVDYMVHKVVSNSPEGFDMIMTYCIFSPDMAHKTLLFKALSQELNLVPDNYERLYLRIKKYLQEATLSSEEHAGLCQVLKNLLWSTSRSKHITSFDEIITDIHNFNSTLEEELIQDLIEDAIKAKVDVSQILAFLGRVPSALSKIRALIYICGHIDGYSNIHEVQLQLAYATQAILEEESYKKIELLYSLAEAFEALPSYATHFLLSGKFCLLIAGEENKEQESVFLVDGNQRLFTPKEDGMTTSCDFDEEGKLMFYKEAPPKDVTGETKCELGDFHPTGEHGVNCSLKLHEMNVFVCDDAKYIVDGPTKFLELRRLGGEQMASNLKKWEENCVAHE